MEALKSSQNNNAIIPNTETKSWVASRFSLVSNNSGVSKRRCKFADCGKEYARGTSHMILKRHWSKQHADQFSGSSLRKSDNDGFGKSKSIRKKHIDTAINSRYTSPLKGSNISQNSPIDNKVNINQKSFLIDVRLIAKRLKEAVSIHLTFDIYTPKKGGKSYGVITAHSLGDNLEIKSVLLEYKHLPYPDDSNAIYEFLRICITRFKIKEKIISIASSCSDVLKISVQEMDKRFRLSENFHFKHVHIQCFPHFIHLNVMEIFKSQEAFLDVVRKIVGFINNDDSLNSRKLPFDNRSNWKSTYNMIESFAEQRDFIEPTLIYSQGQTNIDWERLFSMVQLLRPFHDLIDKFAVDNYTPVSLIAAAIPHLVDHLSNVDVVHDELILVTHNFKLEMEAYQEQFQSDLIVVSALLDPRVKDAFINPEIRDEAIEMLRKRLEGSIQTNSLTKQYSSASIWSKAFRPIYHDEVADYLGSPREHVCINNAHYWKHNEFVYPNLYNLAKTLICVQATGVPSDRIFSAADNSERDRKVQVDSTSSKELMRSWAKYLEK